MLKTVILIACGFSASIALGSPIGAGPISLSGSGTYTWSYGSGPGEIFSASGTNGMDTVSISVNQGVDLNQFVFPGLPSSFSSFPPCTWSGIVTIDGISGGSMCSGPGNVGSWTIGDGAGFVNVNSSPTTVIASATVIGYLQYSNVNEVFAGSTLQSVTADFTIHPTPEPGTTVLLLLALAGMAALIFRA